MCEEKRKVFLVGIGMGTSDTLTCGAEQILKECDCIVGAKRMLENLAVEGKTVFTSYQPAEIHAYLKKYREYKKIAAVFSGDTGFYSGAKKLQEELEQSEDFETQMVPGISSIVYLAARLNTSWEDAKLVSTHGRKQNYISAIAHNHKTFLLLGKAGCSWEVCRKLICYGLGDVEFTIGSRLSYPDETLTVKKAEELIPEDFDELCTACVINPHPYERVCLHISDEEFIRGKVPMTKEEVRTISLSKLKLTKNAVLYDVGAGTGSVSVEAALQSENIRVYAIEKNPKGIELIRQNSEKFQVDQITVVEGTAPDVLKDLETPTHVFIGGSDGNLKKILDCVLQKNPKARIVLNAVSLETVKEVMGAIEDGRLKNAEIVQLSVSKSRTLGTHHMMLGQNPVYVISAAET